MSHRDSGAKAGDETQPLWNYRQMTRPFSRRHHPGRVPPPQSWSNASVLFPGIESTECPTSLWGMPFVTLGGNVYAAATTVQLELYPIDPSRSADVLLRRVEFDATGIPRLGRIFWALSNGTTASSCVGAAAAKVPTGVVNSNCALRTPLLALLLPAELPVTRSEDTHARDNLFIAQFCVTKGRGSPGLGAGSGDPARRRVAMAAGIAYRRSVSKHAGRRQVRELPRPVPIT